MDNLHPAMVEALKGFAPAKHDIYCPRCYCEDWQFSKDVYQCKECDAKYTLDNNGEPKL